MASSCSNNNTPITLTLQDKNSRTPASTNISIALTQGWPVLRKTLAKDTTSNNLYSYIQHGTDLLKQELKKNTDTNMEFKRNIEKALTKAKWSDRDNADQAKISYEWIITLEKGNYG